MCDKYLLSYHRDSIVEILNNLDLNKYFSIKINFLELFENDPNLGNNILKEPEKSLQEWDAALRKIQMDMTSESEGNYTIKKHVHCRIYSLPMFPELHRTKFPQNDDANKFLQVTGTVIRMTSMRMLEFQREYVCTKCKHVMTVNAEYEMKNMIKPPNKCLNPVECKGTNVVSMGELSPEFCKDYQEIRMQETVNKLDVGSMPTSMWVTLEDDLVDSCKPGDNITVCGVIKRRSKPFVVGKKIEVELVIKANHIQVNNNSSTVSLTPELKDMFQAFWKTYSDRSLAARNIILKSICPQLFGLFVVKLAVAVVLAGGSDVNSSNTGVRTRAEPHLLLVGDPGTGKSQLLRFASRIIPRSVLTTGVGSTAAGLTVTAVMENGEWQLEGGALVLSDGGICCIDEFNSMKEHDRISIHEAMEQQSISVAKASIVCKLSTRCSILAATNPKGNIDPSQPLNTNVALASPLLSRFDLILLLRDKVDSVYDSQLVDYILSCQDNSSSSKLSESINWTVETLQAYFAVIKKIHPTLTDDSNRILSAYYQAQRRKNSRNKSRTTVRLLDSLVRLSQGHARLMYHEEVQIVDAVTAVILLETSMETDSSIFDLRFDVRSDFPDDPVDNYRKLAKIVLGRLELDDLLRKELQSVNRNATAKRGEDRSAPPVHQIESRFFHVEKNQPEFDRSENAQKTKRVRSPEEITSKKIRLGDNINDLESDAVALSRMPSVNDVLPLGDIDEFRLNCEKEGETEVEDGQGKNETAMDETGASEERTGKESSQRTKVFKQFMNKFRLTSNDDPPKYNSDNADAVPSKTSEKENDFPATEKNACAPKFKFKKIVNADTKISSSIFESQEDLDDLDLNI